MIRLNWRAWRHQDSTCIAVSMLLRQQEYEWDQNSEWEDITETGQHTHVCTQPWTKPISSWVSTDSYATLQPLRKKSAKNTKGICVYINYNFIIQKYYMLYHTFIQCKFMIVLIQSCSYVVYINDYNVIIEVVCACSLGWVLSEIVSSWEWMLCCG